jgi:hypothetical protein
MSLIKVILVANADGTVHLPVPPELQHQKLKIEANIELAEIPRTPQFGCLAGQIWMAPDFDEPLDDFKDYME